MDKIHPDYYAPIVLETRIVADPLDFIRQCRFSLGSALKYLWRAGKKPGESEADDLRKASFYLKDCRNHEEIIPGFVARGRRKELEVLCEANAFWKLLLLDECSSALRFSTALLAIESRLKEIK